MSALRILKNEGENKSLAKFFKACAAADVQPTTRQLRKFKEKRGAAYKAFCQAS